MKIILCIFLLNITVSVFGQSVELNGILGESLKFPAAVKKGGYLMYGTLTIGESSLATPGIGNYRGRLDWDICTGLFSLSGLKMEDIGEYKVQNTDQNITVFQLNVYKDNVPVSKPHVSVTQNEYPCAIECTAERGTEATLSWYREGEKKSFASSRVASAPHLHLPHSVESGTYTCEAKNSVSNEKASITVGDHCTAPTSPSIIAAIIISVIAAVWIVIAVVFVVLYLRFERRRRAVRTLIQVKKLLDNVDLHAYDETDPPDAVKPFILVKKLLRNVDPHKCAVKPFILVKELLDNVDPHVCVPPDAVETFILVKELLDNVDPHVCGFIRRRRGDAVQAVPQSGNRSKHPTKDGETRLELSPDARRTLIQVEELLNVGLPAYGKTSKVLSPDAVRTLIDVTKLLIHLFLHASGKTSLDLSPDVKKLFDDFDLRTDGKTSLDLSPDAVRTLIDVKKLFDDFDLRTDGKTSLDLSPDD